MLLHQAHGFGKSQAGASLAFCSSQPPLVSILSGDPLYSESCPSDGLPLPSPLELEGSLSCFLRDGVTSQCLPHPQEHTCRQWCAQVQRCPGPNS